MADSQLVHDETEEEKRDRPLLAMADMPVAAPGSTPPPIAPAATGAPAASDAPAGLPAFGAPIAPAPPASAPAPPVAPRPPAPPMGDVVTGQTSSGGTSVKQRVMSPDEKAAQAKLDAIEQKEEGVARQQGAAEARNAGQEYDVTRQTNAEMAAAEAQAETDRIAKQATLDKLNAHIAQKTEEYAGAKPTNLWDRMSNGAKFLAGLSIFAGGVGAGLTHSGQNQALEQINRAIEDDYQRQKDALTKSKEYLALKREDAAKAEELLRHGDYDLRIKKLGILEKGERMLREQYAKNGMSDAQANTDARIIGIQKQRATETAQLQKEFGTEIDRIQQTSTQRAPAASLQAGQTANLVFGPGGKPLGVAATQKGAEETNEAVSGYAAMRKGLNEYRDLIRKHGSDLVLDRDTAGRMDALRANLLFQANHMVNTGVLRPSEQEYFESMIPKATGWSGTVTSQASMLAKTNEVERQIRERMANHLDQVGVGRKRVDLIDQMTSGRPGE